MGTKLRVATTGTGYFSQFHYNAWSTMEDVELVAICNRSQASAEEFAKRYNIAAVYGDLNKLLNENEVDILDIITPPVTHPDYVRAALEHNITVICQKPFTPTLEQAKALVADIESTNGKVVIHENFRFQPWYGQIKLMLDEGLLGDLYQISFRLRPGDGQGPEAYLDRQPYFQEMERFLVHETAIHLIDVFRYLFGEVQSVFAQLNKLNPVISGEDAGIILFNFENGARGLFDGNRLADHIAQNRRLTMGELVVEGSKATLRLNGNGEIFIRPHGSNDEQPVQYSWENTGFGGDCVRRVNQHVVDHLTNNTPLMNTAKEYMTNLQIEQAVYTSSESGSCIALGTNNQ